jgi:hypothetical protein
MLSAKPSDGLGWALFIIGIVMLLFLRFPQIYESLKKNKKEEANGNPKN